MNLQNVDLLHWRDGLAPGQTRGANDDLLIGGIAARTLAETYGTPLITIDLDAFDAAIAEFIEACASYNVEIAYAGKALLLTGIVQHIAATPLALDVCSLGEIVTAERAGFPAERMTLHGCGKPNEELDAVLAGRVGTIVVDSIEEIHRLTERAMSSAQQRTRSIRIVARVNTGIEAHTHAFIRTGGSDTKFGIPSQNIENAIAALKNMEALHGGKTLQFTGLHSHIGSQIYEAGAFVENVRILVDVARRFADAGLASETLIVGGGFGVQNDPNGDATIPVKETITAVVNALQEASRAAGIPVPRLGIEPGRALIARAGTSIYRVMARKQQFDRSFVVVDGSLADNPRPALYEAYHHVTPAWLQDSASANGSAGASFEATICGRSCENDVLGYATLPGALQAGDLLAMCTTGAYTYSMASNYNRFAKPAVVALQGGTHRLLARRQTLDEVLQLDTPLADS
jgi:diaminopimelate decarboxylase